MYLVFTVSIPVLFVQNDDGSGTADQIQNMGVGVIQDKENAPTKHLKHFSKQKALIIYNINIYNHYTYTYNK